MCARVHDGPDGPNHHLHRYLFVVAPEMFCVRPDLLLDVRQVRPSWLHLISIAPVCASSRRTQNATTRIQKIDAPDVRQSSIIQNQRVAAVKMTHLRVLENSSSINRIGGSKE